MMNVIDLEQNDPERIKLERDLLAKAIWQMGVDIKLINPNIPLTGPFLLQICSDVALIEAQQRPEADDKRSN